MEIDLEEIQKFIKLMEDNNLVEFELEKEGFRIALKKGGQAIVIAPTSPFPAGAAQGTLAAAPGAHLPTTEDDTVLITSPMVGTFYASASPDSPPYVTVGQRVEPTDIVCIIEAMKVMNEIPADVSGTVVEILVSNAEPVEYGQALFRIRKD